MIPIPRMHAMLSAPISSHLCMYTMFKFAHATLTYPKFRPPVSYPSFLPSILYKHDPSYSLFIPQTSPDILPTLPPKLLRILPPHPGCLHIRRALIVRTAQHRNNTQQNRLRRLHGRPPFRGGLVSVFILFRWMKDRDADFAVGVDYIKLKKGCKICDSE